MNNPPVVEQKQYRGYHFDPLPDSDSYVMTLLGIDEKGVHEFNYKGNVTRAEAVEYHWGTRVDGKAYFLRTWPQKWIIAPLSHTALTYKALVGELPHRLGPDTVTDMLGKAALVNVVNKTAQRKDGSAFTVSGMDGVPSKVPGSMKSMIIPLEDLKDEWLAAMEPAETEETDGEDAPF